MKSLHIPRLDKTALTISSLHDESDEKEYWLSKTPYERLQAVEIMRQIVYGYGASTARIQRYFEVLQRKSY
jgi:hypothetical protein